MKLNFSLDSVLYATILAAALAGANRADADSDDVSSFKGTVSGMATFDGVTPRFNGSGQFTQLGAATNEGSAVLLSEPVFLNECGGGLGLPNVNTEILTASNGDQLVLVMNDVACIVGDNIFHGTGIWEVFYGTGRFANAKGTGSMEGDVNFNIGFFKFEITGQLEDVGKDE